MRVLLILMLLIWHVVTFPLRLLDYVVLRLPREIKANKWRKTMKVGDKAYFVNILGTRTEGKISIIWDDEARLDNRSGSTPVNKKSLYPLEQTNVPE